MDITIEREQDLDPAEYCELIQSSGLIRPTNDLDRIRRMISGSNLIFTARKGGLLIGAARALSDFSYATYLSDLAVRKEYQRQGIGKLLIQQVRDAIGSESMLLLCAGPLAREYYGHIGFEPMPHAWIIHRTQP